MTTQQKQQLAYEMTMEYFRFNQLFVMKEGHEETIVKKFAEIQNNFYKALNKNSDLFDFCL